MQDNQSLVHSPSPYQLLDLLTRLLTVGIFSTTGGARAWFELFLVIATLASCGYLIWWQVIFLIFILIFGTLAAGLLTLVYPQILTTQQFTSEGVAISALHKFSRDKIQKVNHLSGDDLKKHKDTLLKAAKILQDHPTLLENLTQLEAVFQNIKQDYKRTQTKIQIEEKEVERQRQEVKLKRQKQEAEQTEKRQENEPQSAAKLERQRRGVGFSGGHPPLNSYGTLTNTPDKI